MVESAEGIGGRKWSLAKHEDGTLALMEGKTKIATLTEDGAKVLHLLVKAPQLWDAGNELLKALLQPPKPLLDASSEQQQAAERMANIIAAAVNKTDWKQVLQAEA